MLSYIDIIGLYHVVSQIYEKSMWYGLNVMLGGTADFVQ